MRMVFPRKGGKVGQGKESCLPRPGVWSHAETSEASERGSRVSGQNLIQTALDTIPGEPSSSVDCPWREWLAFEM